jgi:general secretion pathway protein E/type IV pilus assembly protein PilB
MLGCEEYTDDVIIYEAKGCTHCEGQGYAGRASIIEILKITSEIDDLITRRASARELREAAKHQNFCSLAEDACRRVLDGTTSLDDISRLVDLTYRLLD